MKILAFADMHGSDKAWKKIKEKIKNHKPDFILCAGDFTIFEQKIEEILDNFEKIGIPFFMIPGNHESGDRLKELCRKKKNLIYINKGALEINDYVFVANEGNGFSTKDEKFEKWSKKVLNDMKKKKGKKFIVMTHAPPYNTNIDHIIDEPCGNKAVRKFIEDLQPVVAVSGHLHECAGKDDMIKKTLILNPGPYGKIIEV